MTTRSSIRPEGPRERGAALLTAMVAVAVLTAVAVDLAYSARVSLQIAANARDELRAEYLARSGVAMGRVVLSLQQQLDGVTGGGAAAGATTPGATTPGATTAGGATGTAAAGALPVLGALAGGIPRIQLWNLVPVDGAFVDGLFGSAPVAPGSLAAGGAGRKGEPRNAPGPASGPAPTPPPTPPPTPAPRAAPGPGPTGPTFDTVIEDEARKVNASFFGFNSGSDQTLRQRVQALYQLICPARYDPLFDREDANGVRVTRDDILVRLRDWVNDMESSSSLNPGAGSTSAQCGLVVGQPPFADGFGDKNLPYSRGDDRYRTKNRQMDSLDELFLVAGIGDAFMGAFGDSLTVYLRAGDKQNVNTLDRDQLVTNAFLLATPKNQALLFDPELGNKLVKAMREMTFNGTIGINVSTFGALVRAAGIQIDQNLLGTNGPFTDRSKVFRIRATGKAGAVRTVVDAVVRMEDTKLPGEQIAQPGRIIHWRED